jgi:hypothetical protein
MQSGYVGVRYMGKQSGICLVQYCEQASSDLDVVNPVKQDASFPTLVMGY